jgi:hypothetical protein
MEVVEMSLLIGIPIILHAAFTGQTMLVVWNGLRQIRTRAV